MTEDYKVIYSPAAKDDLRSIYRYIGFDLLEPGVAKAQVDRIRDMIRRLDAFPHKHPVIEWEPWLSMGLRRVPVDNYVIVYRVDDDTKMVTVVRIFFGGQDIERIIERSNT